MGIVELYNLYHTAKCQDIRDLKLIHILSGSTVLDQPVHILSDSLLPPTSAAPQDDTLVPYSPSALLNTDVAQETLKSLNEHETSVEQQAHWLLKKLYRRICLLHSKACAGCIIRVWISHAYVCIHIYK